MEILIIDDEIQIRRLLGITLQSHGFIVREAENGKEGLLEAAHRPPDLVILDLGLPDESGHAILEKLREWYSKPILILSARDSEDDIVKALDNGANDYLVKPFRMAELLARIRSSLRNTGQDENKQFIDCNEIHIDLLSRIVKKHNEILKLTSTEYALLVLLARHQGKVLTHQFILKEIWGPSYINESQYLRVYIAQLRKKIEDNPNKPLHLITESGVGYRFTSKEL